MIQCKGEPCTLCHWQVNREDVKLPNGMIYRWVVRMPNPDMLSSGNALYGYSSTFFGAWRMVYQAHGERMPCVG